MHYPGSRMHTKADYLQSLTATNFSIVEFDNLTTEAIPHWEVRSKWERASGIEPAYLEGHKIGKIFYLMVSAVNNK